MALKSRRAVYTMRRHCRHSFPNVKVLEFPNEAAAHYAQKRAELKKRGQMIGANYLFTAAHARNLGLRLVTNNTAEFAA